MSVRRALFWSAIGALVVLGGRALAYGLAPHPQLVGSRLEQSLGGPRLVVTAGVAPMLALALAAALVWLATIGVRERHQLVGGPTPEPLRIRSIVVPFTLLWPVSCLAFAALESFLHWRAGLGFHGLHCLVGPVHRNAIPLLGALSLVASAASAAGRHVWSWVRRTFAALTRSTTPLALPLLPVADAARTAVTGSLVPSRSARAPPPLAGFR